jgi:IS5 family transposase
MARILDSRHFLRASFKHRKTRYKGLTKNTAQLFSLFALTNQVLARRWLLGADNQIAS